MFSSLFSSKNQEVITPKNVASSGVVSRMKGIAGKISVILGLTAASNVALAGTSVPVVPDYRQEISTIAAPSAGHTSLIIDNVAILPPKSPVLQAEKVGQIEPVSVKSKLRVATAQKGESVGIFMLRNFETQEGWELLVEKETGNRVRVATRDLIAGKTYVLARSDEEAKSLAGIFKKQVTKKATVVQKTTAGEDNKIGKQVPGHIFVEHMKSLIGLPYVLGGNGITSADCSGALLRTMQLTGILGEGTIFGKDFPRLTSGGFKKIIEMVGKKNPRHVQAGDIIYSPPRKVGGLGHVMLASGPFKDGKIPIVQASGSQRKVVEGETSFKAGMIVGTPPWISGTKVASLEYSTLTQETPQIHENIKTENVVVAISSSSKKEKSAKTMVATVSANDARFTEAKTKAPLVLASADTLQTIKENIVDITEIQAPAQPKAIELKPVGEVKNVVRSLLSGVKEERKIQIETELKTKLIDRARNSSNLGDEERKDLLTKLEKVTDLYAYYQNNIANQELLKRNGSAKEKVEATRILPGLYKLLSELESKLIVAENDSNIPLKRAA